MDFGARPPEITSGQMYVGAGSGLMLAAAAAWGELARELHFMAASYRSTIEGLTIGPWTGPSSIMMVAAAAPFVWWISTTAVLAEQAAMQASLAAAAYETAFATVVPPQVIAANRSLLMELIITNILGQNTPKIAIVEAHYMEMWAQDAATMYVYAESSAMATQLTPFTEPPQITNPARTAIQSAAVVQTAASDLQARLSHLINSLPSALQTLATHAPLPPPEILLPPWLLKDLANWNAIWSALTGPFSFQGWSSILGGPFLSFGQVYAYVQNGQGLQAFFTPAEPITGALAPIAESMAPHLSSASLGGESVAGAMGRAALVGGLAVPQGWTQAAPVLRTLASVLPANVTAAAAAPLAGEGGVFGEMALSSLAGRALSATTFSSGGGATARSFGGVVTEADPAAATIIVIPALED